FFSSRRRHTRFSRDWSSDVCSSDLLRIPYHNLKRIRRGLGGWPSGASKNGPDLFSPVAPNWVRGFEKVNGEETMIKRFPSYGALDAFLASNQVVLIQCWPDSNGEWVAKLKA